MTLPKISIITVVYNAKDNLKDTLKSIISLKYDEKEIIIIDGGSTDGTKDVIAEFAVYITTFISEPDNGIYDAMNKGLAVATGEFVWFLNAGDFAYSDEVLSDIFEGQELSSDVYYGETLILSEDRVPLGLRKKRLPKKLIWQSFKCGMVVCHQSIIVKREIVPKYNLKYRYAADVEWVLEVLKRSKTRYNTHQIISKFTEGGVSSIYHKESLKERYNIMVTHFGHLRTLISHFGFMFDVFRSKYRKM